MKQTKSAPGYAGGLNPGRLLARVFCLCSLLGACHGACAQLVDNPPAEPGAEAIQDALKGVQEVIDQIWIPRSRYTNSPHMRAAFRSVVADVRKATVEVRSGGRQVAMGGVVGPDGWVVTKASLVLVHERLTCRLKDGREFQARLVGVDEATDLAMLKLDANGLPTLTLEENEAEDKQFVALKAGEDSDAQKAVDSTGEPPQLTVSLAEPMPGDWLATAGLGRDPMAIGVISVAPRKIPPRPGFLGIRMDVNATRPGTKADSVLIEEVTPKGAAEAAGLLAGDRIVTVDGKPTRNSEELREAIMGHNPGDRVEVVVRRGKETKRFVAVLHGWEPNPAERRAAYQNALGGKLSERRFGFPLALQHDTPLEPDECGGPVVDLDGRVVGFNISRAGRTESYALPVELVRERLFELMSGRLAPPE